MRHTNIVGFLTPTSDQSLDRIYRHMNYEGLAVQRFDNVISKYHAIANF